MKPVHLALGAMYATGAYLGVTRRPALPFNDPDFVPTQPTPVLYVHGFSLATRSFATNAAYLREHGYWTWGYDYGTHKRDSVASVLPGANGFGDPHDMVAELAANVNRVRAATGSDQVDIVAHSLGGMLTKLYIADGGADRVRRVVAMGGNFRGTEFGRLGPIVAPFIRRFPTLAAALASPTALQQLVGSPFIDSIADVPDTDPTVVYTSIYTPEDRIVTPNDSSILRSVDGANVVNIDLTKAYPDYAPGTHTFLPRSPQVAELTRWGLERPARRRQS